MNLQQIDIYSNTLIMHRLLTVVFLQVFFVKKTVDQFHSNQHFMLSQRGYVTANVSYCSRISKDYDWILVFAKE